MPTGASARLGLDAPATGVEQVQQGDDLFRAWRLALEARVMMFAAYTSEGARPAAAAGNAGTICKVTDTGVSYYSTGFKWLPVGGYIGQLTFSAASFAPDGFLICTGQPVTTTNAELRDWLIARGNPHGSSGGNPLLPNTPGRAPVAAGSGAGLTARTAGQTFGAETHAITVAEMPVHNHVMRQQTGIGGGISIDTPGQAGRVSKGGPDPITAGPAETENAGSGAAMRVEQPSVVMTMLIQAR